MKIITDARPINFSKALTTMLLGSAIFVDINGKQIFKPEHLDIAIAINAIIPR